MEPGLQNLKANTLPHCCKSRLLPEGSRITLSYLPYDLLKNQLVIMPTSLQHDESFFEYFCSPKMLKLAAVKTKSRKNAKHGLSH